MRMPNFPTWYAARRYDEIQAAEAYRAQQDLQARVDRLEVQMAYFLMCLNEEMDIDPEIWAAISAGGAAT